MSAVTTYRAMCDYMARKFPGTGGHTGEYGDVPDEAGGVGGNVVAQEDAGAHGGGLAVAGGAADDDAGEHER